MASKHSNYTLQILIVMLRLHSLSFFIQQAHKELNVSYVKGILSSQEIIQYTRLLDKHRKRMEHFYFPLKRNLPRTKLGTKKGLPRTNLGTKGQLLVLSFVPGRLLLVRQLLPEIFRYKLLRVKIKLVRAECVRCPWLQA